LKEQSSSLGRAGRTLEEKISAYLAGKEAGFIDRSEPEHLKEIGLSLFQLLLQRELSGFIDANLCWITKRYKVPEKALRYSGVSCFKDQKA